MLARRNEGVPTVLRELRQLSNLLRGSLNESRGLAHEIRDKMRHTDNLARASHASGGSSATPRSSSTIYISGLPSVTNRASIPLSGEHVK